MNNDELGKPRTAFAGINTPAIQKYLQKEAARDEHASSLGRDVCEFAVELLRKRDARIAELENEVVELQHRIKERDKAIQRLINLAPHQQPHR